ncbi:MAG: DUF4037 domain-containing protein [Clostridium sp.]|nr:DUF4037 domain-containing protein [Clostridium sp.]
MKGLELARNYFKDIGLPMIRRDFGTYESRIAAGLAGEGSEVLGFDDELSRDHDWGPSFCIWLTDRDAAEFGRELNEAYSRLPGEYMGYPARNVFQGGEGRVGVIRISDFYRSYTGLDRAPETPAEWLRIPESMLAKAAGGQVFMDGPGEFSKIRQSLLNYYPSEVRLKKISVRAAVMAQSGQYNYPRCLKRGELVAAACALSEFTNATCSMVYLLNHKYMPFYKWAHHGLQYLPALPGVFGKLEELHTCQNGKQRIHLIEEICTMVRCEWKRQGIIDGSSEFLIDYSPRIIAGIQDPYIKKLHIMEG